MTPESSSLKGRVAVVTGASRGLGKAMAAALAEANASVVLVSRDIQALESVAGELAGGARHLCCAADVADPAVVDTLAARVLNEFGRADILINNAGTVSRKPLRESPFEEWRSVIATNLFGPMLCSKAFLAPMVQQSYGRILNIASIMAHIAMPGRTAYCASKGGLVAMTRALALELAPDGITVNSISPGPFVTEMTQPLREDPVKNQEFVSKIPLGRWGRGGDIGPLVVYMASEASGFITGTDIVIDGGWTAK